MKHDGTLEVQDVYGQLLEAWNNRSACGMEDVLTKDGESIGFDGSQSIKAPYRKYNQND